MDEPKQSIKSSVFITLFHLKFTDKSIGNAYWRVKNDYAFFTHYKSVLITSCLGWWKEGRKRMLIE